MAIEMQDDGNNVKLTEEDLEAYLKIRFPDYKKWKERSDSIEKVREYSKEKPHA